ncbi:hypothetical protein ACRALDRAFT_211073 [Sodiomyces alcalophilus JCM 7366]|uniref:uncharacterized protein n=1 Tax=Sodiomyces alcalophilus JCM 7366 TaxID=591952 RepID=UPI0039B46B59
MWRKAPSGHLHNNPDSLGAPDPTSAKASLDVRLEVSAWPFVTSGKPSQFSSPDIASLLSSVRMPTAEREHYDCSSCGRRPYEYVAMPRDSYGLVLIRTIDTTLAFQPREACFPIHARRVVSPEHIFDLQYGGTVDHCPILWLTELAKRALGPSSSVSLAFIVTSSRVRTTREYSRTLIGLTSDSELFQTRLTCYLSLPFPMRMALAPRR